MIETTVLWVDYWIISIIILILIINIIWLNNHEWQTKTPRKKESKIKKSKGPESPSVETNSTLSNKLPISLSATPKLKESKSQDQLDCPTNIFVSPAEDLPAVRVLRHGITGKWVSIRGISIWSALLDRWRKWHLSPSLMEYKSVLIFELLLDYLWIIYLWFMCILWIIMNEAIHKVFYQESSVFLFPFIQNTLNDWL